MSQSPTKEGLLGLLGILDLIPSKYSAQLERNYDVAVEMWTQMSEAQWKESIGVQEGIMLYNYLHPEQAPKSSALDLNILGTALPQSPTKEGLLGLLGILDLIPSKYSAQLERNYDVAVEMWTQMSEAQWKESIGVQEGIMLYNYLHPSPHS
ncbi:hypothetical protein MP638_006376, partial [Amoeboaphelidium occidentale]